MNTSPPEQSSVRSLRLLITVTLCLVVLPLMLKAAAPGWWTNQGVIKPNSTANDYAIINQGQVKNLAQKAMQELDDYLPGGAGDAVHQTVGAWAISTVITNDHSPVKLGALKELARPFYQRLIDVGYTSITVVDQWQSLVLNPKRRVFSAGCVEKCASLTHYSTRNHRLF